MPICDNLFFWEQNDSVKNILCRHEQDDLHSTIERARSTGQFSVCILTAGPIAANVFTGIATAQMDSVLLIQIDAVSVS